MSNPSLPSHSAGSPVAVSVIATAKSELAPGRLLVRCGAEFVGITAALWVPIEIANFFLKLEWIGNYRFVGLAIFAAVAALGTSGRMILHLAKQCRTSEAERMRLESFSLAQIQQVEGLQRQLVSATTQDVTTAIVTEIETAFTAKRWEEVIRLCSALSRPLWITGRYSLRTQLGALAESAAAFAGNKHAQASALIDDLGWTKVVLGRLAEGRTDIQHGVDLARSGPHHYILAKGCRHLSGVALKEGDLTNARHHLVAARAAATNVHEDRTRAELEASYAYMDGLICREDKDPDQALHHLEAAQKQFHAHGDTERAVKTYGVMGDIYLAQKNLAAAKDSYRTGLSTATRLSRKDAELRCLVGLANTSELEANPGETCRFLELASQVAGQMGQAAKASELLGRASAWREKMA
jgi:tetratricopeptide (TPR) repeat protein